MTEPAEPASASLRHAPSSATARMGRRERNKQEKLDRILAAARTLFTEHGIGDVTTQQVADLADIGTGTLFLYARTKAELLLMVQNSLYADALARGRAAADELEDPVAAVMAVLRPIVECNRAHVDNGRAYLREVAFGDPGEQHHAAALEIVAETSALVISILERVGVAKNPDSATIAGLIEARMFIILSGSGAEVSVDDLVKDLTAGLRILARIV